MAENLILFYSRRGENDWNGGIENIAEGDAEIVAESIQRAVGGDLFEVDTVRSCAADCYTCIEEAKQELHAQARPALKRYLDSADGHGNVFVCGPCWWVTFPMAIFAQLEKLDLTGKKAIAVMTHEGSGLGSCERELKRLCPGAVFGKGLSVHGADAASSESAAAAWAKKALGWTLRDRAVKRGRSGSMEERISGENGLVVPAIGLGQGGGVAVFSWDCRSG